MKYYLIAGEASGDLHGSNLIKYLIQLDPQAQLRYWGGDLMKFHGGELVKHYSDMAFMGFYEVLQNIPAIISNFNLCKKDLLKYCPDVLILIDYPGFNLRIARWAKANGIKVFYYISPKVWAWNESRVKVIKKSVDKMFVILPFEKDFYKKWDYEVEYVGNPLLEVINSQIFSKHFLKLNYLKDKPIIALLPGSRKQEISRMLPLMISLSQSYPDYQFVIAAISSIESYIYYQFFKKEFRNLKIVENNTYELLHNSYAAVVTSGTAALEAALLNIPQVICYKTNFFSYIIAKMLIKTKYISLVNLILGKEAVKELIQNDCNINSLKKELDQLLNNNNYRSQITADYKQIKEMLEVKENPSKITAQLMVQWLQENR